MSKEAASWNPAIPGQEVRLRLNPGYRGQTTGKMKQIGNQLMVQIELGPNERSYKPYDSLELCREAETIPELLKQGRFGTPDDLRRILTFEKIKGHLTNVFYSMEASNTEFYPHQFKPVLKLLESPVGRLLIADEVGLGKTVEAMYVWKELQARIDARRLLIVCPAILREKWYGDLLNRFNLRAEITNAQELVEKIRALLEKNSQQPFFCITSFEGIRPITNWADEATKGARSELARLLDYHPATEDSGIFDLVIIDEAHYLRNQNTANHRLGRLLRDASRYLLLLTATPIQIHSTNLYQLLRLINPDDFFNESIFQQMLEANAPILNALKLIWSSPPNYLEAKRELNQALRSPYFTKNPVLHQIHEQLAAPEAIDDEMRVKVGYRLESISLLSQYVTRSRKRDVIPDRVKRASQTLTVAFSPLERQVYNSVTHQLRLQTKGKQGIPLFRIMIRQRQMASCLIAALQAWSVPGDLLATDEMLWEDFGIVEELGQALEDQPQSDTLDWQFQPDEIDYSELERQDTKYQELISFLHQELQKHPYEKFVLFAYFRGTLHYLQRRLEADQICTYLIMGDMGDTKWEVLKSFENSKEPSILLSSEVGSEGIDLQFCRILINYDLPWNPMRIEQRIGRLDRLGQKAEQISIINFSLVDTVEEQILEKLYSRINIFKESIGDLENILGDMTEKLIVELLEPSLSDEARELRAEETAQAILKQRVEQERLEEEAINMLAFSDQIFGAISKSREQGRWLQPEELISFVQDFFALYYPGTIIEPLRDKNLVFKITLSEAAKIDLQLFLKTHKYESMTHLHARPKSCFFDPKVSSIMGKDNELIDPTHPLVQWIRQYYENNNQNFHAVSAIQINQSDAQIKPGIYTYTIHRWSFTGLRTENRIAYKVANYLDGQTLSNEISEALINRIKLYGKSKHNAISLINNFDQVLTAYQICDDCLEDAFHQAAEDFGTENMNRCDVQQRSAEDYANRRQQELQERIQQFREDKNLQMVPATEGLLKKVNRELELKLKLIDQRRAVSLSQVQLGAGIIFID
jgi:superfamily II DNA or RNA helicase